MANKWNEIVILKTWNYGRWRPKIERCTLAIVFFSCSFASLAGRSKVQMANTNQHNLFIIQARCGGRACSHISSALFKIRKTSQYKLNLYWKIFRIPIWKTRSKKYDCMSRHRSAFELWISCGSWCWPFVSSAWKRVQTNCSGGGWKSMHIDPFSKMRKPTTTEFDN